MKHRPCPSCTDVQVDVSTKNYLVSKTKHTLILYELACMPARNCGSRDLAYKKKKIAPVQVVVKLLKYFTAIGRVLCSL